MKQPLGVFTIPKKCNLCGVSKFRAILDSPLIKSIPFQTIKIQEISNNDQVFIFIINYYYKIIYYFYNKLKNYKLY